MFSAQGLKEIEFLNAGNKTESSETLTFSVFITNEKEELLTVIESKNPTLKNEELVEKQG